METLEPCLELTNPLPWEGAMPLLTHQAVVPKPTSQPQAPTGSPASLPWLTPFARRGNRGPPCPPSTPGVHWQGPHKIFPLATHSQARARRRHGVKGLLGIRNTYLPQPPRPGPLTRPESPRPGSWASCSCRPHPLDCKPGLCPARRCPGHPHPFTTPRTAPALISKRQIPSFPLPAENPHRHQQPSRPSTCRWPRYWKLHPSAFAASLLRLFMNPLSFLLCSNTS